MDYEPTTTTTIDDWIPTARAARLLGVTARRVRQLVDEKELEGKLMTPRFMVISRESLERYMLGKA